MLVALYKTFRGGEWLETSMESIKDHVDAIVLVHSCVEWNVGASLKNNCTLPVTRWRGVNPSMPVFELFGKYMRQEDQYEAGYEFIRENFGLVKLLLIDTDEVWDSFDLGILRGHMALETHAAYCCQMKTYVKSPFYRVFPPETCRPVVGIDMKNTRILGPRGMKIKDRLFLPGVWMHHFTYVRRTEDDIRVKFRSSAAGDGVPGREDWFEKIWPKIPYVLRFHPSKGHETSWGGIEVIKKEDLPVAVQDHVLVRQEK